MDELDFSSTASQTDKRDDAENAAPPPTDADDRQVRPGSARERHLRRKARKDVPGVSAPKKRVAPPQLLPARNFKLPKINVARLTPFGLLPVYAVGAVIFMLVLIFVLGQLTGDPPPVPSNALWVGTEWSYDLDEEAEVPELVQQLQDHQIGRVYAWVSWLKPDGEWAGRTDGTNEFDEVEADVVAFVNQFDELYPQAQLYGWISLPTGSQPGGESGLANDELRGAVATFSARVVGELGFEGVFINAEPVWDGDESFLQLLREVREAIGDDVPLAVAIPPDWSPQDADIPVPPLIRPGTVWAREYKQNVALLVDEMALMAYNSGLRNANDYSAWMAYQVEVYADAIYTLDDGTDLVIGIPTYEAELPGHDPLAENIPSALAGIEQGLLNAGDAAEAVAGVAIYAEWTTEATEWTQFRSGWLTAE